MKQGLKQGGKYLVSKEGRRNVGHLSAGGFAGGSGFDIAKNENTNPVSAGAAGTIGAVAAPVLGVGMGVAGAVTKPVVRKVGNFIGDSRTAKNINKQLEADGSETRVDRQGVGRARVLNAQQTAQPPRPDLPPEIASVVQKADAERTVNPAQMGAQARQNARDFAETKISRTNRIKDAVSQEITDDTNYFQALDRQRAGRNMLGKVNNVPAAQRLDPQVQAFRNSTAMQEQRYKDMGIEEFASKLSNNKDYNNYTIYRTFRTNDERARLNKKPDEDVRTSYARWTGGRDYGQDAQAFNQLQGDPKYNALFTEENAITQKILRDRGADPNLSLSPREAEEIIAKYPNFTPQKRVMEDDLNLFQGSSKPGSMQGKNVKTLNEGSFSRALDDPMTALKGYSDELVQKSQGNKIASTVIEQHPETVRPLVTAEQLQAKEAARINLSELGLAGRAVERELRSNSKAARAIQSELNKLNREGKDASLKQGRDANLAGKLADPSVPMSRKELASVLDDLVNLRPADLQRITNKIASRDAKLAPLMQDIARLSDQVDDIKAAKVGIWTSGDLDKFEKATNKNTIRRVKQDDQGIGREEIYQVIDPRMAQNLDQLKGHELSTAAQRLGVPARVFKFFTTGPGSLLSYQ